MDYLQYENELYHYGVKGMKWGHRKLQRADGSLTSKGQKRLAKNEAYREKLAKRAQRKSESYKSYADEAKYNVSDLKKRGTSSAAYRKWKEDQLDSREREYEFNNKITAEDGTTYHKSYRTSGTRFADEFFDGITAKQTVQKLIDENNADAKRYTDSAKRWTNSNKNLMNMEVSALTTKKEIKRVYRS